MKVNLRRLEGGVWRGKAREKRESVAYPPSSIPSPISQGEGKGGWWRRGGSFAHSG